MSLLRSLWLWFRHGISPWHQRFIASPAFLVTPAWRRVRYQALRANDGRCELCGRSKHDGIKLNVDHVRPRRSHPWLALDPRNLQVLCEDDNAGKGNRWWDDWRHASHPHRR